MLFRSPQGYLKDETIYEFEIEPNGKVDIQLNPITINNERAKVKLDFTKRLAKQEVFVNEQAYKDVIFGLYAKSDLENYMGKTVIKKDSLIYTLHIDENGKLIMDDYLPSGEFYLKELQTNEQYGLDPSVFEFNVDYYDNHKDQIVVPVGKAFNYLKRGSIEIIKTTEDKVYYTKDEHKYLDTYDVLYPNNPISDKNYLAGVLFELATDEDFTNIIAISRTNGIGKASFRNLEMGTYYIREKASLKHYVLTDEVFKVELTEHDQIETIEVNNELVTSYVDVKKVDYYDHSKVLPFASFTMFADQECTKVLKTIKTGKDGIAHFDNIKFGTTVYIKETKAPAGYELSDEVVKVTINDAWINGDKETRIIVYPDRPFPASGGPNTGDSTNILLYVSLLSMSLISLVWGFKKRKNN